MASRCDARSTSPPRIATIHAAGKKQQMRNNGRTNCANQGSDYPTVLTASDPPPESNIEEQGISFAAVEVPAREGPQKEQSFWPFGPTGEAVASFETSGLFSGFEGATSDNTGSSTFEIKEGPIQGLELCNHITGGLAAITGLFGVLFNVSSEEAINSGAQAPGTWTHITGTLTTLARALIMAVMLHHVWIPLGSCLYNRVAPTNTNGQPETFGGIINAEDGLALAAVSAAEKWNRRSNRLFSVMVGSGASGHYFDDALIPGLRYRLDNYQALAIRRWITTAGGHQLKEAGQGLLRGHSIGAQGLKRLTRLLVLATPDVERDLFSVKQDGALWGQTRYREPRRAVNHESNLHQLGKRLQLGEFHNMAPSNILSS